jgi:outer membrane lipoprotein carrier protein
MKNTAIILLAATLALAGCAREPERTPDSPAPPDNIPAAPGEEATPPGYPAPAPDTIGPAAEPRPADTVGPPGGGAPAGPPPAPGGTTAPPAGADAPQPADEGAAVLQRASTAYAAVRSMRAGFVMQLNNPLLRQQTTSRGTLYQQRPDRIALRFSEPAGDVILSDGEYFWLYYPSMDAQQVIRQPVGTGNESTIDLQAQFVGDPVTRFRYTLHDRETVAGRPAHVLTLVPRERADYRSLKVWLDTRDSLARRFEITDHNGAVRRFDLQDLEVNPAIPAATFRFSPPAGARIVNAG